MIKTAKLLAGVALGVLCVTSAASARGGGGGHGGGHFGGGHFGGVHVGRAAVGFAHTAHAGGLWHGEVGHAGFAGNRFYGSGLDRLHSPAAFDHGRFERNAFGTTMAWHGAGVRHWTPGWHRWGGWAGPVFWPYFYGDVFTYLLWPGTYGDPFWAYGPDFVLSSIYWPGPYAPPQADNAYGGLYDVYGSAASPYPAAQQPVSSMAGGSTGCSGLAPGVTDMPFDRIRQAVEVTPGQTKALDDLQTAAGNASAVVAASCPSQVPLTPVDRLDAVQRRLEAMIQAVGIVRGPLETFYGELSDGQKQLLSAMGGWAGAPLTSAGGLALCDPRAATFAQLPVDRIERTIQPSAKQEAAFEALKAASASAAAQLQASCPVNAPQSPVDRIDAVETRLNAMVQAAGSVRPALQSFYASLNDEQKAQFDVPASYANAAAR